MVRLIDADELIDVLNSQDLADWLSEQEEYTPASIVEHALETLPTVDAEPVRHGKWIFGTTLGHSWMKCSECCVSQNGQTATFTYCPNCGARMVGGEW